MEVINSTVILKNGINFILGSIVKESELTVFISTKSIQYLVGIDKKSCLKENSRLDILRTLEHGQCVIVNNVNSILQSKLEILKNY
jgi:hypothetical protein